MIKEEYRECHVAAVAIKSISKLGLVVFITIPSVFLSVQNCCLTIFDKLFLLLFLMTSLLIGFKTWHLYFDAQLLENVAKENFDLLDINKSILLLFKKKIQNKTLQVRIQSCYKLAQSFYILLAIHLILFFGIILNSFL